MLAVVVMVMMVVVREGWNEAMHKMAKQEQFIPGASCGECI